LFRQIWHPDQMEDRYVLGIGSADSADCTQFADAISRVQGSDPVNATVPVGCIRGIQFVGASYPLDFRVTPDGVLLLGKQSLRQRRILWIFRCP
jgi:hypothetical protein